MWHAIRGRLLLRTPVPVPWDLHMFYLLRQILSPNLSLFRTMLFEYPSVLSRFCFHADPNKKQDDRPGLWLAEIFSTTPLKRLNGIQRILTGSKIEYNESWQEARSQRPAVCLCSWADRGKKQDGYPSLWLDETFSTSALQLLNGIQRNLKKSKILTSSTEYVFFRPIRKTRWSPVPGWSDKKLAHCTRLH